jgi:fatty acid desaturase
MNLWPEYCVVLIHWQGNSSREDAGDSKSSRTQVLTSANWGGVVGNFFTGGLNLQVEHHLFPAVSFMHCALPSYGSCSASCLMPHSSVLGCFIQQFGSLRRG